MLILLTSAGTGTNLSTSNLSTLLFKLLKLVGKNFISSISNLLTLNFELGKSVFSAKDNVSTLDKFNSTFTHPPKDFDSGKCSLVYTMSFLLIRLLNELLILSILSIIYHLFSLRLWQF